ncbi:hypothetical protein NL489_30170, partial [Klebsiella pneumoniae]|nr:hypothetical protein [Klebsiella pneumoniae]
TLLKIFPHTTFSLIIAAIFVGGALALHAPGKKRPRKTVSPVSVPALMPVLVPSRPSHRLPEKTTA